MSDPRALTHARVLRLAGPIVLANISVPLLGAVDTGVVGQLGGAAPIGAVGIGATILAALYWVFGFLRMGTAGLAAQALGARDEGELSALLTRALGVGLIGGAILVLAQAPLFWAGFRLAPASTEVEALARDYMAIRIWSAPAAVASYAIMGWLIGRERTRAVLVVQLAMNGVNIGLDLLFVLGLGWGVEGVALATVLAEGLGLALGLWLCRDGLSGAGAWDWARVFDRARLARMARVNRDILIRSLLLQTIVVSFMFWGAGFGDEVLAANQVLMQFLLVISYGLDGFAFAAESLVGQAVGARAPKALRRAVLLSGIWGGVAAIVLALGFGLLGGYTIDLMAVDPGVREAARAYLPWVILAPVLGLLPFLMDGVFIGATRTADMRNMMLLSAMIYGAAAWVLMALWGNHGLWIAYLVSYVARGLTLAIRYPALERSAKPL